MVHDHDWQNEPPVDFNKSYDEHYGDEEDEALPKRKRFFLVRDVSLYILSMKQQKID